MVQRGRGLGPVKACGSRSPRSRLSEVWLIFSFEVGARFDRSKTFLLIGGCGATGKRYSSAAVSPLRKWQVMETVRTGYREVVVLPQTLRPMEELADGGMEVERRCRDPLSLRSGGRVLTGLDARAASGPHAECLSRRNWSAPGRSAVSGHGSL